jgi:hypothetical protein
VRVLTLLLLTITAYAQTFPKGHRVVNEYSLWISTSECQRAYGLNSTPDIPWTLGKGHTWTECWDRLQTIFPDSKDAYIKESVLRDFMQGPTFMTAR